MSIEPDQKPKSKKKYIYSFFVAGVLSGFLADSLGDKVGPYYDSEIFLAALPIFFLGALGWFTYLGTNEETKNKYDL